MLQQAITAALTESQRQGWINMGTHEFSQKAQHSTNFREKHSTNQQQTHHSSDTTKKGGPTPSLPCHPCMLASRYTNGKIKAPTATTSTGGAQ
jgi:hypothetical protein